MRRLSQQNYERIKSNIGGGPRLKRTHTSIDCRSSRQRTMTIEQKSCEGCWTSPKQLGVGPHTRLKSAPIFRSWNEWHAEPMNMNSLSSRRRRRAPMGSRHLERHSVPDRALPSENKRSERGNAIRRAWTSRRRLRVTCAVETRYPQIAKRTLQRFELPARHPAHCRPINDQVILNLACASAKLRFQSVGA